MNNKDYTVEQTRLAFDFMHKLYLEISFLIKEIESILSEEEEKFIIGKPGGYGITTRSSTGLDSASIKLWMPQKLAVFFVPESMTETKGGQTSTEFSNQLKTIYLRILLNDKNLPEPLVHVGVLYQIEQLTDKYYKKFEHIMAPLEYMEQKIFKNLNDIHYEDVNLRFKGKLNSIPLYDLATSQNILDKVINPTLDLYRRL